MGGEEVICGVIAAPTPGLDMETAYIGPLSPLDNPSDGMITSE